MTSNAKWKVVVAPYSLRGGEEGSRGPTEWEFAHEIGALISIAHLTYGQNKGLPQRIAGPGNGYDIYATGPDGRKHTLQDMYRIVAEFMGTEGRDRLDKTMMEISRDGKLLS